MSNLENELKSAERTLIKVAEAVLSGSTLRIIVPDDRNIVPDSLLQEPHTTEIFEVLRSPDPDLNNYALNHLFPTADHYRIAANYLQKNYDFTPGSEVYEEWLAKLVDQLDQYLQSEYSQFKNVKDEACRLEGLETDPELEDKDILAAVAVIDSASQIAERLVVSDSVVPCNLDEIIQLAELHSFCDASFKFWESEKTKEAGRIEVLSTGRQKGHEQARQARQEIKNKLTQLIPDKEFSQYLHSLGKKIGQPKTYYILALLQREFKSDPKWKRDPPGATVMLQEIDKFMRRFADTSTGNRPK